ncbi:MAG TPA: epoxide hydrolase, partial [Jatrophihabitans sp.]|nr:epoxide hydrolase [Jatrophihabitans sp.]
MTDAIERFEIAVPEAELSDLHRRLAGTRWPDRQVVDDWSQGIPLDVVVDLVRHWRENYDWRQTERRLNRIPQFRTVIDDVPIHFVHVRSPHPDATPVVLTHGWPGSFLEFEQVLPGLADPPDGNAAFHVVVPSLPGYAFSGRPTTAGWNIHRIAAAWCELTTRLGYRRFLAAGSDWGTSISTCIALDQPDRLLGLHLVPPLVPPDRATADHTAAERQALTELDERSRNGSGYSAMHGTRPQTLGYGLTDSPAGLAAWIGEKLWTWTERDAGGLTIDQMLDNISLYWLTGTATSSTRLYWESIAEVSTW